MEPDEGLTFRRKVAVLIGMVVVAWAVLVLVGIAVYVIGRFAHIW